MYAVRSLNSISTGVTLGERKYEVFRRMTADLTPQNSFSNSIIYPEGKTGNFFFAGYPLLMTSLKQDSTVVTWQYRRVPTRDTTFHFQGNFPLPSISDTGFQYVLSRQREILYT